MAELGQGRDEYESPVVKSTFGDAAGILGSYIDGEPVAGKEQPPLTYRYAMPKPPEKARKRVEDFEDLGLTGYRNPEEVRTTSSTGGQKGSKPSRHDLIPSGALDHLARHYGIGASKYADWQWRKGYEWGKSYAALQRHLNAWWGGEDLDEETGSSHMAAAAWHCFTLLTFIDEFPEFDDRFKKEVE
jgi:hypothetical protein